MQSRYPILRVIQNVYRVLAWVVSGLMVLAGLIALVVGATIPGGGGVAVLWFLASLIYAAMTWIGMMLVAELISVFIDTEENTRMTAQFLQAGRPPQQ